MSSLPSDQAAHLLNAFTSFLTVAIHSLLYHRALYPATSFLTARAHNLPVHQSRHPGVCAWVRDAVAAAEAQIRKGAARSVALVVHAPPEQSLAVLERWVFDLRDFPVAASWGSSVAADAMAMATTAAEDNGATTDVQAAVPAEDEDAVNWTDVNEALRGALSKIAYAAERSQPLPENCTFTLAVELHEQAAAPIGHPQPWIPATEKKKSEVDENRAAAPQPEAVIPVRSVNAGPLFFECWLEKNTAPETKNTSS